jgi:hypothetical protein
MRWVDFTRENAQKKNNYRLKHNAGDESHEECCLHYLSVLEVGGLTTLVVGNSLIPQSVDPKNELLILHYRPLCL